MNCYILNPTPRVIKTPFTAFIKYPYLIALRDGHVWIFFSNGHWLTYDLQKNAQLKEGKVSGDASKLVDVIKSPSLLDDEHVVYVNCTKLKIECLNIYTGTVDSSWTGDAPTVKILPQEKREQENEVSDALNEIQIEILQKSKLVGILERKQSAQGISNYYFTLYKQGSDVPVAQVSVEWHKTRLNFGKGNEENTFILWTPHQHETIEYRYFKLDEKDKGFQIVSNKEDISATLTDCLALGNNTIAFVGNKNESGIPWQYNYDLTNKFSKGNSFRLDYYPENHPTVITEVLFADTKKKVVALTEFSDKNNLVIYNSRSKRADFFIEQKGRSMFASGTDGNFIVEYQGALTGREDPNAPGETKLTLYTLISKKMFMLFFMKNGKTKQGKTFWDYYADPYLPKHIGEFL